MTRTHYTSGMPYKDLEKKRLYKHKWNRLYYAAHKEQEKERIEKRRKQIAQWFVDYKSSLYCRVCNEKTIICLDFHHTDAQNKDFQLGNAKRQGWSIKRLQNEIAKCVVLCANCHRKVHAGLLSI